MKNPRYKAKRIGPDKWAVFDHNSNDYYTRTITTDGDKAKRIALEWTAQFYNERLEEAIEELSENGWLDPEDPRGFLC